MAHESLKAEIRQYIKTNGQNEITGQILQNVLLDMVNEYPSLSGYATQSWVQSQGYVTNSYLNDYLPLSAGSNKPLTGDLYIGTNKIRLNDGTSAGTTYTLIEDDKITCGSTVSIVSGDYSVTINNDGTIRLHTYSYVFDEEIEHTTILGANGITIDGHSVLTSASLASLTDVVLTNPSDGQVLKYNATTQKWVNGTGGGSTGDYLPLTGGTLTGILTIQPENSSGYQDALVLHDNGTGESEGARIRFTSASYTTGITLGPNSHKTALMINGTDTVLTSQNISGILGGYLPLSAGSTKQLTGDLYIGTNKIRLNDGTSAETTYTLIEDDKITCGSTASIVSGDYSVTINNNGTIRLHTYSYVFDEEIEHTTILSATGLTIDGNAVATQTWVQSQGYLTSSAISDMATQTWVQSQGYLTSSSLSGYLPLSAGSGKALTDDLYITAGKGILASDYAGLLVYAPSSGWTGISSTQWGVGAIGVQGVIRSNDTDLLHYKASTSYKILDESNWEAFRPTAEQTFRAYEALLRWGGGSIANNFSPVDAGMCSELGANRSAFLKASSITIESSRDNGSTWTDYGASDSAKKRMFSTGNESFVIGKNDTIGDDYSNYQLRVTIKTDRQIYSNLNKFIIYLSTNGARGSWCTIEARLQSNVDSDIDTWETFADEVPIGGWSGYSVINTREMTTYGNYKPSQYGEIRFTIGCVGAPDEITTLGLTIYKIMCFGGFGWTTPSNMAKFDHLYDFDENQNAIFPGDIKLDADHSIVFDTDSSIGMGTDTFFHINGYDRIVFDVSGTTKAYLDFSDGLYVDADGVFDADVTAHAFIQSSDIRLKNVVGDVEMSVKDIAKAPAFRYLWKDSKSDTALVGSSAQYWQTLLPEAVHADKDGMLSMEYGVVALLAAIMTAKSVEGHEQRIAQLERENAELKRQLNIN